MGGRESRHYGGSYHQLNAYPSTHPSSSLPYIFSSLPSVLHLLPSLDICTAKISDSSIPFPLPKPVHSVVRTSSFNSGSSKSGLLANPISPFNISIILRTSFSLTMEDHVMAAALILQVSAILILMKQRVLASFYRKHTNQQFPAPSYIPCNASGNSNYKFVFILKPF